MYFSKEDANQQIESFKYHNEKIGGTDQLTYILLGIGGVVGGVALFLFSGRLKIPIFSAVAGVVSLVKAFLTKHLSMVLISNSRFASQVSNVLGKQT